MDTSSGYKDRALESLKGVWDRGISAVIIDFAIPQIGSTLLAFMVSDATTSTTISGLWSLACLPLAWGVSVYFLRLVRGEDLAYGRLFDGYSDIVRILGVYILYGLAIVIGTMLLIVPGIIAWLMFSQAKFILKDDPQIGVVDCLKKSAAMMDGHKMDFFLLCLSFIGWFLLAIITLGLGLLFLMPYFYATCAHFYEDLKAEQAV